MPRLLHREHGQELVEFALILPLLLLITLGIIDFAMVVFSYDTIGNAAREGARYGIVHPGDDTGVQNAVVQLATGLNLAAGNISVTWPSTTVRVQVDYNAQLISGFITQWVGIGPTIPLRAVATMQLEQ